MEHQAAKYMYFWNLGLFWRENALVIYYSCYFDFFFFFFFFDILSLLHIHIIINLKVNKNGARLGKKCPRKSIFWGYFYHLGVPHALTYFEPWTVSPGLWETTDVQCNPKNIQIWTPLPVSNLVKENLQNATTKMCKTYIPAHENMAINPWRHRPFDSGHCTFTSKSPTLSNQGSPEVCTDTGGDCHMGT